MTAVTTIMNLYKCMDCGLGAESISRVKEVAGGGTQLKAVHSDGTEHTWEEYGNIFDIFPELTRLFKTRGKSHKTQQKTQRRPVPHMTCPRCLKDGNPGMINPSKGESPRFLVRHRKNSHDVSCSMVTEIQKQKVQEFLAEFRSLHEHTKYSWMSCPKCGELGRVGAYRPDKDKHSDKWKYFLVHEHVSGTWGKSEHQKHRRCFITDIEQHTMIENRLKEVEA